MLIFAFIPCISLYFSFVCFGCVFRLFFVRFFCGFVQSYVSVVLSFERLSCAFRLWRSFVFSFCVRRLFVSGLLVVLNVV